MDDRPNQGKNLCFQTKTKACGRVLKFKHLQGFDELPISGICVFGDQYMVAQEAFLR